MSSARKALVAGTAVVVLAVAFALLRAGGADESRPAAAGQTTPGDPPATTGTQTEATADPVATAPAAPAQPAATLIRVRGGEPAGGVKTIEVTKGDRIRFTVSSDQSDEVHVHGYDIERPVGPDAPARFSFTADADGIFEVELHHRGAQIASLEVQPG
jgi:FtsP/CotA-like multicopper oxidase with cupredoxin domain